MRPTRDIPASGDTLDGKYVVDRVLGSGGMGAVVAATHAKLGQKVAIKLLLQADADATASARFLREARAAATLRSEHVVRILDVGESARFGPYIVMEHLLGADLARTLRGQGRVPLDNAVGYVVEACEALAEAHAQGIVHRDIKPANLFLAVRPDGSPLVKVVDFGISKATEQDGQESLTGAASAMGSPLYMSPEQVRSAKEVDARTDVWSLGVTLYELIAATPPFVAPSVGALAVAIATEPHVPLRRVVADVPEGLARVLDRCLAKRREDRFATVGALAAALRPFAPPWALAAADRAVRLCGMGVMSGTTVAGAPPDTAPPDTAPPDPLGGATTAAAWTERRTELEPPRPAPTRPVVVAAVAVAFATALLVVVAWFGLSGPRRGLGPAASVESPHAPSPAASEATVQSAAVPQREGWLVVECDKCGPVTVDKRPVATGEPIALPPGDHVLVATRGSKSESRVVTIVEGKSTVERVRLAPLVAVPAGAPRPPCSPLDPGCAR